MRMGNLATIGAYGGENFHHLLLDNGVHESTGGQSTVSPAVSFAAVAKACGYRTAGEALQRTELESFLQAHNGPSLLQLRTKQGVPEGLPRPDVTPREVKQRLMRHLGVDTPWMQL
jgi:phosphonopyruvate decarboxylase